MDLKNTNDKKNSDALTINEVCRVVDMFMKQTKTGEQVVAGITKKDEEPIDDNIEYVWLPSTLTNNFNPVSAAVAIWLQLKETSPVLLDVNLPSKLGSLLTYLDPPRREIAISNLSEHQSNRIHVLQVDYSQQHNMATK